MSPPISPGSYRSRENNCLSSFNWKNPDKKERASCCAGGSARASLARTSPPASSSAPLPALTPPREVASLLPQNSRPLPKWHLLNQRFAFNEFPKILYLRELMLINWLAGHIRALQQVLHISHNPSLVSVRLCWMNTNSLFRKG